MTRLATILRHIVLPLLLIAALSVPSPARAFLNTEAAWNSMLQFAIRQINAPGEFEIELGRVTQPEDGFALIDTLRIKDGDGVWLEANNLLIDWNPTALLRGRFAFETLSAETIRLLRAPITRGDPPAESAQIDFAWPRPPVPILIETMRIDRIELLGGLLPQDVIASIEGRFVDEGDVQEATLALRRIDREGDRIDLGLRIDFDTVDIAVSLDAQEAAGGLVGALAQIPPTEALNLTVAATGTPENLPFTLYGEIGEIGIADGEGSAAWADRLRVAFDGEVIPEERSSATWKQALGERATINLLAEETTPGTYRLDRFDVVSEALEISGKGTASVAENALDFDLVWRAKDIAAFNALIAPASVTSLSGRAVASGALTAPMVDLDADITGLSGGFGRAERLALTVDAAPQQRGEGDAGLVQTFSFRAGADGLALQDDALGEALGEAPNFTGSGEYRSIEGVIDLDTLKIAAATLDLGGSAFYRIAEGSFDAKLAGAARKLRPFLAGGGLDADGVAILALSLEDVRSDGLDRAFLSAQLVQLDFADETLSTVMGRQAKVEFLALGDESDTITIERGFIEAKAARADLSGQVSIPSDSIDIALDWRVLDAGAISKLTSPARFDGASGSATIIGTMSEPSLAVDASITAPDFGEFDAASVDLSAAGTLRKDRRIPFQLSADLTDPNAGDPALSDLLGDAPKVRVQGIFDTATSFLSVAEAMLDLDAVDATISGDVDLAKQRLNVDYALDARNLGGLSPLVGETVTGTLTAEGRLVGAFSAPLIAARARGTDLGFGIYGADELVLDLDTEASASGASPFKIDLDVTRPRLGDDDLNALVGSRPTLRAAGKIDITAQRVVFDRMRADLAAANATATGELNIGRARLDMSFDADMSNLAPLSTFAPEPISGALAVRGTARGPFTFPALDIEVDGSALRYGVYGADALTGTIVAERRPEGPAPFDVDIRADGLTLGDEALNGLAGPVATLRARGTFDERAQRLSLQSAQATTPVATVDAAGLVDLAAQSLDVTAMAQIDSLAPFSGFSPEPLSGSFNLDATVKGPFAAPAIDADFSGASLGYGQYSIARIDGRVDADRAGTALPFTADITASGIGTGDPKIDALLMPQVSVAANGRFDQAENRLSLDDARVSAPFGTLAARGDIDLAARTVSITADADLRSLAPFSAFAPEPLAGSLRVTASADGPFDLPQVNADIAGADIAYGAYRVARLNGQVSMDQAGDALPFTATLAASGIGTGNADLDALLAPQATVAARGQFDRTANLVRLDDAQVGLPVGRIGARGTVDLGGQTLALDYRAALPSLSPLSGISGTSLSGAAQVDGRLTGPFSDPSTNGRAFVRALDAAGYSLPEARLGFDVSRLVSGPTGSVDLNATTTEGPLRADAQFDLSPPNRRITSLSIAGLGLEAQGAAELLDGRLANADLTFNDTDLGPLARIAGYDASGRLSGRVIARAEGGRQRIEGDLTGEQFEFRTEGGVLASASTFRVMGNGSDVFGADPLVDFTATMADGSATGIPIRSFAATGRGPLSALDAKIDTVAGVTGSERLSTEGRFKLVGFPRRADFNSFAASYQGIQTAIASPLVAVETAGGGVTLQGLDLRVDDGEITGDATYAPTGVTAVIAFRNVPLALARYAGVDLIRTGRLFGTVDLDTTGPPMGTLALDARSLRLKGAQVDDPFSIRVDGTLDGQALNTTATIEGDLLSQPATARARIPLRAAPGLPIPLPDESGALSAEFNWDGDIGEIWSFVPAPDHLLAGQINVSGTAQGTIADPVLAGGLTLTDGRYDNLELGTLLLGLNARADFNRDGTITFALDANDGVEGTLNGKGSYDLGGGALNVEAALNSAALVRRDDATAIISGTSTVTSDGGPIDVFGRFRTEFVELRLIGNFAPSLVNIDVVPVGDSAPIYEAPPEDTGPSQVVNLDVALDFPQQVFVRGRGLESEWGGQIAVTGTAANPRINGLIERRRGWLDLIGSQFELAIGEVRFNGGPLPRVRVRLQRESNDITGWIDVAGRGADLDISFGSNPALPEDEILPRLLFGRSKQSLSGLEAAQLAAGVATLTSGKAGALDTVRGALGVDVLRFDTDDSGATSVSTGKYVADGVFVGARQNLETGGSSALVEIEVFDNFELEGEFGADDANASINWKKDY